MMTRVAGALLAIDLATAAADFGAGQRGLGALTHGVELGANHHMDRGVINFGAENRVGELELANLGALHIEYCYLRHFLVLLP